MEVDEHSGEGLKLVTPFRQGIRAVLGCTTSLRFRTALWPFQALSADAMEMIQRRPWRGWCSGHYPRMRHNAPGMPEPSLDKNNVTGGSQL